MRDTLNAGEPGPAHVASEASLRRAYAGWSGRPPVKPYMQAVPSAVLEVPLKLRRGQEPLQKNEGWNENPRSR